MRRLKTRAALGAIVIACVALAFVLAASSPGTAQLKIIRNYVGGTAPSNAVGGGNLQTIFNAAADWWELAIKDNHTVTIDYSWAPISTAGTLAAHTLLSQGGSPNRESKGKIEFDSDGSSVYYMDPSPTDHAEFTTYTETTQNFGGGTMNKGRVYTGATGNASGRSDLFAVAIHEIGHSLGLSGLNTSFQTENADGDIDIRSPLPFAGSTIPTVSGAHLNVSTALMYPTIPTSLRRLCTSVDILSNAEISKFTDVNIKPNSVCQNTTISIPDDVYSNAGNCIPLSECIGGGEGRFQWFIHQSLIGCGGLITGIDVRPISTLSFTAQDFEIRISHTTQTAHSTNMNTNLPSPVVVRQAGPASYSGIGTQWAPLPFDKPFVYDGNSNLTIEVRMRNLKASPSATVYHDSTSATGIRRTYALGAGTYNVATTTTSRTNVSGALKLRLHLGEAVFNPSDTPSTGGANSWPFNTYTAWRYQFIVDSSVLPSARTKITDIAFAPTSTKSWKASQVQIRMGHTTLNDFNNPVQPSCFDNMLGPAPVIVYDGPLTWDCTANAWSFIGLQSPFGYDGSRNILVEIRYTGGPGSSGVSTRTDASINRAYTHTGNTSNPYSAPCWIIPIPGQNMGAMHCLSLDSSNVLIAPDTVRVGGSTIVRAYNCPARNYYQMAASLGQRPAITIGNYEVFLTVDPIFLVSVLFGPPTFTNYAGTVSTSGIATGTLNVPSIPQLVGYDVFHAAVLYNAKGGILGTTNTDGTRMTR